MAVDRIFNSLPPASLEEIRKALDWNPYTQLNETTCSLNSLSLSAKLEWLDSNRAQLEEEVSSAGSWTFGSRRAYAEIVRGLADQIQVAYSPGESTASIESSILLRMWKSIEVKLGTQQKEEVHAALEKEAEQFGINFGPQLAAFGALGAAQLSGFGVYMLGSTLLGAVNGALGLGLGFGVFTGLSSLISVAIGPAGWLFAGGMFITKLTAPNYKKIAQIVLIIATCRNSLSGAEIATPKAGQEERAWLMPAANTATQMPLKRPLAFDVWNSLDKEPDLGIWAWHTFGQSDIGSWTEGDFAAAKALFEDGQRRSISGSSVPDSSAAKAGFEDEAEAKPSVVNRLKLSYKAYFPLLEFDHRPLAVLAQRDYAERLEFEQCFSRMNRGDLRPKCVIKNGVDHILEKQVGKKDERVYYRQLSGGRGARIILVGTKATQLRDIARLRSQFAA